MSGAKSVNNNEMESENSWISISYSNDSESDNPPPGTPPPPPHFAQPSHVNSDTSWPSHIISVPTQSSQVNPTLAN